MSNGRIFEVVRYKDGSPYERKKNDTYVKKLIMNEIWSPGDLGPSLGMKSRQEFKFEPEKLPGSRKIEEFLKCILWSIFRPLK